MSVDIRGTTGITAPGFSGDGAGLSGTGTILQVVQAETSIVYSTTSDAWQDIFSATITPTKTTSDILVSYHLLISAAQQDYCDIRLLQEGSQIGSSNAAYGIITYMGPNDDPHFYSQNPMTQQLKVSPNTTAPITFKLQFNRGANTGTAYINRTGGYAAASSTSTITLMEIGA